MEEVLEKVDAEKIEKYDRQLRLWGAHGQEALENAHICLINAGATGTEILKNLVLPGIGGFTIIDGNKVEEKDLGNNFFVEKNRLGESRAKVTTELLLELNEWVKGEAISEDPIKLIDSKVDSFKKYSIVIACDLPDEALLKLAKFLYTNNIPLFSAKSYGFIGFIRWSLPELTVIESKPEELKEDLRLNIPFTELKEYAIAFDLDKLDSHLHSHVPFPLILIKCVEAWKSSHDGKMPSTRDEKNAFKQSIKDLAKKGGEINFQEAHSAAFHSWIPYSIDGEVQAVLDNEKAKNVTKDSTIYWILVNALRQFVEKEKILPLIGSIPDMTADTNTYMKLQSIYANKAKKDMDSIGSIVKETLKNLGRSDEIPDEDLKRFCKNTNYLRVLNVRSLEEEFSKDGFKAEYVNDLLDDPEENIGWYVVLRAVGRFYGSEKRYPGDVDANVDGDFQKLKDIVTAFCKEVGLTNAPTDDQIKEIVRYGASEMHNIGAVLGGVASQEVIKVLTRQWLPFENSLVFNGINATTSTYEL